MDFRLISRAVKTALPAFAAAFALLGSTGAHAQAQLRCAVPSIIPEDQWKFDIKLDEKPLVWSAKRTAHELYSDQYRMFTPPGRSFVNRSKVLPSMGLYDPHISWTIEETRAYSKTVDNRFCAQITGATLVMHFAPEVLLAREMPVRNCVSEAAFKHQLLHDKAMREAIKGIFEQKQTVKDKIYPVYSTQGAAGANMAQINEGSRQLEQLASSVADNLFTPYELGKRRLAAETPQQLLDLSNSCGGQFGELAQRAVYGKPLDPKNEDDDAQAPANGIAPAPASGAQSSGAAKPAAK